MKQKKLATWFIIATISQTLLSGTFISDQTKSSEIVAPLSIGELIDKLTILEIKSNKIKDPDKLAHIHYEIEILSDVLQSCMVRSIKLVELRAELFATNNKLWNIEDAIREKEFKKEFDDEFIQLARSVYYTNDHRGKVKRHINELTQSSVVEEKQYTEYQ